MDCCLHFPFVFVFSPKPFFEIFFYTRPRRIIKIWHNSRHRYMSLNIPLVVYSYGFIVRILPDTFTIWSSIIIIILIRHLTDAINKAFHAAIESFNIRLFAFMGEQLTISLTFKIAGNMISAGLVCDSGKQLKYTQVVLSRESFFYPAYNIRKLFYKLVFFLILYRCRLVPHIPMV